MRSLIALAAACATSVAAFAQDASPPTSPAPAATEKKVCRSMDPAIGSNRVVRVCKTREEWAAQRKADRRSTGEQIDVAKFRDTTTQFAAPKGG